MDEELGRRLALLLSRMESVDRNLDSIRKMLKFFVVLTIVAILIQACSVLLR